MILYLAVIFIFTPESLFPYKTYLKHSIKNRAREKEKRRYLRKKEGNFYCQYTYPGNHF